MGNTNLDPRTAAKVPVFILAGGLGTRISEESVLRPKPMIEVGGDPILLHIMRWYYQFGFNDFVICAGYRSWEIKQFFLTYGFRKNNIELDHRTDSHTPAKSLGKSEDQEKWRVRVIDTGLDCMTGGRIARAMNALGETSFEDFAVTYGDGVCDVDLAREFSFHQSHGLIGTVLGVHPSARFGELSINSENRVLDFSEKPQSKSDWINGGFFFFKKSFQKYLSTDATCILERAPLFSLSKDQQLKMHSHDGFWQPMDTLRDKNLLESLVAEGKAPWISKSIHR